MPAATRPSRTLRRSRFRKLARLAISVPALLGCLVLLATWTPLVSWWAGKLCVAWNNPAGDVLIVLGGDTLGDRTIGMSSYLRSAYAAQIYHQAKFRQIVISGKGVGPLMKDFLVSQRVPPGIVRLEDRSRTTRENALYTTELLKGTPGRKMLLTSDFHMFRAYRAFRKAGLEVASVPSPDVRKRAATWRGRWPGFLDLVQESMKILYYFAKGWI